MENKTLYTNQFKAGRRNYFFDVKRTNTNNKYLAITESKKLEKDGDFLKNTILIFEEDIEEFGAMMTTTLINFFRNDEFRMSRMQELKSKHKNAYKPWTQSEDLLLEELFCSQLKTKEISKQLERNRGAITSRINKLELRDKYPHL